MKYLTYKSGTILSMLFLLSVAFTSCDFEYVLPDANSKADETLPSAGFSYSQTDPEDFRVVSFANASSSSTRYLWDFGIDGATSTEADPSHTYPGEGTWTVTLTSSDENGESSTATVEVVVIEPEEPDAIVPEVLNGDFTNGQDDWKFSSFTGGTTSPFNSSSDGSNNDYDGNDTGAKTPGAKWTNGTSAEQFLSDNTRFAYQAFTVSPNTTYVVEWEYAIKDETMDVDGGDRLVLQILGEHFEDGKDALEAVPLSEHVGLEALGKGNFTLVKTEFETNDTGEIAIRIYGVTSEDAYVDNVKLYPKG